MVASDLLAKRLRRPRRRRALPEAWEAKRASYGTEYMSRGASDSQRRVSGELVVIQQQLDTPGWAVRSRLVRIGLLIGLHSLRRIRPLFDRVEPGSGGE